MSTTEGTTAVTDVSEFIIDLDGGMFERKLSAALSQVAAAVVDNDKSGEVTMKLTFKKIPGTHQVLCDHQLKFSRPTMGGKTVEEDKSASALHVGKFGKLSLAPESQLSFMDREGKLKAD